MIEKPPTETQMPAWELPALSSPSQTFPQITPTIKSTEFVPPGAQQGLAFFSMPTLFSNKKKISHKISKKMDNPEKKSSRCVLSSIPHQEGLALKGMLSSLQRGPEEWREGHWERGDIHVTCELHVL